MNILKNILNFFRLFFQTLSCKNNKKYNPRFNDDTIAEYTKLPDIENYDENERYVFTNWDNFMIR